MPINRYLAILAGGLLILSFMLPVAHGQTQRIHGLHSSSTPHAITLSPSKVSAPSGAGLLPGTMPTPESSSLLAESILPESSNTIAESSPSQTSMYQDPGLPVSWREAYVSGEPLSVGNQIQFLFDDFFVEDKYGLKRVLGPVTKYPGNPLVIGEDMPWERASEYWGGANLRHVLYDPFEQMYKAWYVILRMEPGYETGFNYSTLYAESRDGIEWVKPGLEFYRYDESKAPSGNYADRLINSGGIGTNIVLHRNRGTALLEEIMLDPSPEDPSRRFIALVKMIPPGETVRCIVRMYSPDGKSWHLPPDPVLFRGASDGSYSLVRDNNRNRWLLYRRPPNQALVRGYDGFYARRNTKRRVAVSISKDLMNWTIPRNIVVLDEKDDAPLEQPGNRMDIDWAQVVSYKNVFWGFLSFMDNLTISVPRHSQLMWSRDGLEWHRLPERPRFIENGHPGEWDSGSVGGISMMPDREQPGRLRIYYTGGNTTQGFFGRDGEENIPRFRGTGLAYIDEDRFIGLQAGPEGGYLLTREFLLEGSQIQINVRYHVENPPPGAEFGWVAAELVRPGEQHLAGTAQEGFSLRESDPLKIHPNQQVYTLTWKGSSDVSAIRNESVYVRFYLQNVTLYTIQILP